MLEQKKKHIQLCTQLSHEEYHELKIAIHHVSMNYVSGELTQKGREGLHRLMNYILPAMKAELKEVVGRELE